MIGTSFWEYVFIRTSIFALRSVTPLCVCYIGAFAIRPFGFPGSHLLLGYAALETGFYLLVYLPRKYYLQAAAKHPELLPVDQRQILFERCSQWILDPEYYLRKWFLNSPPSEIKRENVKDFFRWAMLNTGDYGNVDEHELDEYCNGLEKLLGRQIPPGRGKAKPLRTTVDNFHPQHRPLIWYMV